MLIVNGNPSANQETKPSLTKAQVLRSQVELTKLMWFEEIPQYYNRLK